MAAGGKIKNEDIGGKKLKGGKRPINASFLGYKLKLIRKKINLKKRKGGGIEMIEMYNIYPCFFSYSEFQH